MSSIYSMDGSFNFLLQATRVLQVGNYYEDDLQMIYEFMTTIDNDTLYDYNSTCTILSYNNDLELYMEIVDVLISTYEEKEEYEKCKILLEKKNQSIKIINQNTI